VTDANDREALLKLAREAIETYVSGARAQSSITETLAARRGGVFVTVYCRGDLRGCIGQIVADEPLVAAVQHCARSAASADPRFSPITAAELDQVDVELSLLGPLEPIDGPSQIEIGRHGLVVERGGRRGLLLPQVATEWEWNAETFLARTCQKAGLPLDAWKAGAAIWRFEAEVFGETSKT